MSKSDLDTIKELATTVGPSELELVVLRFLARVVHADKVIHDDEMQMLVEVAESFGLDRDEAQKILDDEVENQSDPAELAAQIDDETRRRESYALGCLMSFADGATDDSERGVLAAFASGAGIADAVAQAIFDSVAAATVEARTDD